MQAPPLPPVATLWIGEALSWLEQLCLTSFLHNGHEVRLYCYDRIENVPSGVTVHDASTILPAKDILRHERTGSPAIHADLFRLHLMRKTDCIWIDADVLCWRPFSQLGGHVFGWEKPGTVCNAVLRLPAGSAALAGLFTFFEDPNPIPPWAMPADRAEMEAARAAGKPIPVSQQRWGTTGPGALTFFLQESGEIAHARHEAAFYPIPFSERRKMVLRRHAQDAEFPSDVLAVHLWGRRIKRRLLKEPGALPRNGSFLARMIRRHRIDAPAAPIVDDRVPAEAQA